MMINCKESAIRSSELRDRRLKGIRKLELWYHVMICRFCRIYDRQIKKLGAVARLIGEASSGSADDAVETSHLKLSPAAKTRIKQTLQD